ncbi:unnamed protein product [Allacma fusca]|uniref:Uncharacterized protein n=1 Tax=Allacma fusca TaxID=39272 RepID=A0A8J2PCS0_9HEXA|nr:unnamed protein product [Allacma fusca]
MKDSGNKFRWETVPQERTRKEAPELDEEPHAVIVTQQGQPDKWLDASAAQQFRKGLDKELDRYWEIEKKAVKMGHAKQCTGLGINIPEL